MVTSQTIIDNWDTTAAGYSSVITELFDLGYPAWTIKPRNMYGVAIPIADEIEVNESFSGAVLCNEIITLDGIPQNTLLLITEQVAIKEHFATICAEFIMPGENGELRKEIVQNPVAWWASWKDIIGNRSIDDMVYDSLGELCVLKYLLENGKEPNWNGPTRSTYDIDCGDSFYEVKSTTSRSKKQITLSNRFQLVPPQGEKLMIVLCQFEAAQHGLSINSVVDELVSMGYNRYDLNQKLKLSGLEQRKSSRKRCYILHAMTQYVVDENFPAIRDTSFVGGAFPTGIESLTYTLSLDGIEGERIF